jgi:hypothetical protein
MEEGMAEEKFDENLMRMIAAELHVLSALNVAREMYGKGYFALGAGERAVVDQAVVTMVGANYQAITPQYLAAQTPQQQMGFGVQPAAPTQGKS